jgi:MFS family permease
MRSDLRFALAGTAVLALALGVGRFAFTPLLPLMQADADLGLTAGGWLASINNIGYLLGALLCTVVVLPQRAALRTGMLLVAFATAGMGATTSLPLWLLCRFAAGMGAALLVVHGIAWCTARLPAHRRAGLESLLYSGPGIGIAVTGTLVAALRGPVLDSAHWWFVFGALGAFVVAMVWRVLDAPAQAVAAPASVSADARRGAAWPVAVIWGLLGFSYIIPAIFLPLIADAQLHVPALREWFWPMYGVAAVLATWVLGALPPVRSNYAGLAGCCFAQLVGIFLCLHQPRLGSLLAGAVLLGAMTMPSVMYTMREAGRIGGHNPTRVIGVLTISFGAGQITGPVVAATLATHHHGFTAPLELAALATVVALLVSLAFVRRRPSPVLRKRVHCHAGDS